MLNQNKHLRKKHINAENKHINSRIKHINSYNKHIYSYNKHINQWPIDHKPIETKNKWKKQIFYLRIKINHRKLCT